MLTSDVLKLGSNLDVLKTYPDNYFSAVVTDPPYGLEFMGKDWDKLVAPTGGASFSQDGMGKGFKTLPSFTGSPNPICRNCKGTQRGNDRKGFKRCRCEVPSFPHMASVQGQGMQAWHYRWAIEVFRVVKPGGHVLAFGGTRTWHRLASAIEDAGFEIRDTIAWMYGSGFPKSFNISKAFDKKAGATRKSIGKSTTQQGAGWVAQNEAGFKAEYDLTEPSSPNAIKWDGWGTALKPAFEPIVVARKPLIGNITDNIIAHGTGGINIDDSRVGTEERTYGGAGYSQIFADGRPECGIYDGSGSGLTFDVTGRFPSNVLLGHHHSCTEIVKREEQLFDWGSEIVPTLEMICHADCPVKVVDEQAGELGGGLPTSGNIETLSTVGIAGARKRSLVGHDRSGGASRFFYQAKPDNSERYFWCKKCKEFSNDHPGHESHRQDLVMHPTQKPVQLMRYLIRMVTPPGGIVLDPFVGSGTTCVAAKLEGIASVGIEMEAMSHAIARHRYRWAGVKKTKIPLEGLDS